MLQETPFYGESGGQVGDIGVIGSSNFKGEVIDTQKTKGGLPLHYVKIVEGNAKIGDIVVATVDERSRNATRRNHSATHVLHKALKDVLGEHVNQAGSLVTPNRMRFDFTHFEGISKDDLDKIERIVNDKILQALDVVTIETSLKEAQEMGAVDRKSVV